MVNLEWDECQLWLGIQVRGYHANHPPIPLSVERDLLFEKISNLNNYP